MKVGVKKAALIALGSFGVVAASPVLAFAAEEKSGIAVLLPDPIEFIPMLVAFIVLLVLLVKFGWPMFDGMLVKREETIKNSLEQSEAARIESERVLAEYKQQLQDIQIQADQIIADAKQAGSAERAEIVASAHTEASSIIEKARADIEQDKLKAAHELQDSLADLSIDIASRLIGENLNDEEHRRIIENYVSKAGSFNAN